ncbi:hypothetical protein M3697_10265 [Janibacter melonis]|uniref:hypothetical protein n=1 Tax=Janibacter melonis TaxID=262209 RepID=UPI0020442B89|nr:hypothetical protein [Janibacter melonis]MCM3555486.1 hypothetical protein [Janibacter melonis]
MATYLATVQIGRYEVIDEAGEPVPVRVVVPADRPEKGFEAAFGMKPQMLGSFAETFGNYPFASHNAVITDDDHELSHQWWGNSVTVGALARHQAARGLRLLLRVSVVGADRVDDRRVAGEGAPRAGAHR